jgi:cytochrome c
VALGAVLMLPGLFVLGAAQASTELQLKYGCRSCHLEERKLVGPAYQAVAKKYRVDKGVEAGVEEKLIAKVKSGGSGAWGVAVMPPHPSIPDADLRKMVGAILATPAK